jgi:hypothetical protein
LPLGQGDGRKGVCFGNKRVVAGGIAGEQVLEDATVRGVGHGVEDEKLGGGRRSRKMSLRMAELPFVWVDAADG